MFQDFQFLLNSKNIAMRDKVKSVFFFFSSTWNELPSFHFREYLGREGGGISRKKKMGESQAENKAFPVNLSGHQYTLTRDPVSVV